MKYDSTSNVKEGAEDLEYNLKDINKPNGQWEKIITGTGVKGQ